MRVKVTLTSFSFWFTTVLMSLWFLFLLGETMQDPGGWGAVAYIAMWAVPLGVLIGLALRRPAVARPLLLGLSVLPVLFSLWGVVDTTGWRDFQDGVGPIGAVLAMVLGTALAFLGRHDEQTLTAGVAMLVVTLVPALPLLAGAVGPAVSTLAAGLPIMIGGVLYVIAGVRMRSHRAEPTGEGNKTLEGTTRS